MAFSFTSRSTTSSRDLFDDSTMSFGEHLEVLRTHLIRGLLWLLVGFIIALIFSKDLIIAIQRPVNAAMVEVYAKEKIQGIPQGPGLWERGLVYFGLKKSLPSEENPPEPGQTSPTGTASPGSTPPENPGSSRADPPDQDSTATGPVIEGMVVQVDIRVLARKLREAIPTFPEVPQDAKKTIVSLPVHGTALQTLNDELTKNNFQARTDNPDEAFMIYMIVSLVVGFILASPFIFYEMWQFVAAGLYPHERRYVYKYLPFSIGLFLAGSFFCFYFVIPVVLKFLFGFNAWLELRPELRIGSWIRFALVVSIMFGLSFQLPLIMLLLERISIFTTKDYKEKWRHAILAISVLSMVLTPSDPVSMMMMMTPLCILYGLGIWMCEWGRENNSASAFS